MRIDVLYRPDSAARPGGDAVQAAAVARYLRALGVDVREHRHMYPDVRRTDLAVLFNLTIPEQTWLQTAAVRRVGAPYVLFPVFWDLASAIPDEGRPTMGRVLPVGSRRRGVVQRLRALRYASAASVDAIRDPRWVVRTDRDLARRIVAGAHAVLPNSAAEAEHLRRWLGDVDATAWTIVHNGVWIADLDRYATGHERDGTILCVGGVSPRKNHLNLVRAARLVQHRVVVVGPLPARHDRYARRVFQEAPPNVEFVGPEPHEAVLVRLARASVHCLPSFVETPGIASLEAAVLGAAVCVADTPPVREYLEDTVLYVDPADPRSIADGIRASLAEGPNPAAAGLVRRRYDWASALAPLGEMLGLVGPGTT